MALPALQTPEHRKNRRAPVEYSVHVSVRGDKLAGEGRITDMSATGCCIKSALPVKEGQVVELSVQGANSSVIVIDEATVRWVRLGQFGLSFSGLRTPAKRWIADICRRLALLR